MRFCLAFLAALLLTTPAEAQRLERSTDAMGATFSVVLYGSDQASMNQAIDAAFDEAHRLDDLLSNYKPASEWSRINREAASHPVEVSPELFSLLSECLEYSRASEGTFDLTVGPLMRAWGFFGGTHHVPSREELRQAREVVGYRRVRLDARKRTVQFDHPGVEIDPGGVGKGYAVDRMVEILRARGFHNALVAASGSSIFGFGNPPDEPRGWPLSIADPWDHRKNAADVFLKDQSLSTSGSYEKSFRVGGHRYTHIMDPRSATPAENAVQVSVIAPRAIDSEVWAKPYFVHGAAWTAAHKPNSWRVLYCENIPGAACSWVEQDSGRNP
ncbi:MAG TPA: FAD:protein FMN transferase [Candidatus Sulfotelmatobacter sp.]|nr:FAD:protein FMN transferase [Candidatus Sulfotelmatobacter sp.]